jgi:hypothetical protein
LVERAYAKLLGDEGAPIRARIVEADELRVRLITE